MPVPDFTFAARGPRFDCDDAATVDLTVTRQRDDGTDQDIAGELVNFSRQGVQFHLKEPLEKGELPVVRLQATDSALAVQIPARVRWVTPDEHLGWLVGCEFESEVPWETLGELFIHEVLSQDQSRS